VKYQSLLFIPMIFRISAIWCKRNSIYLCINYWCVTSNWLHQLAGVIW